MTITAKRSLMRVVAAGAAAAMVLVGCSTDEGKSDGRRSITHKQGTTEVSTSVKRMVVMDLAALDVIDALGEGDAVVGLPKGPRVPEQFEKFTTDDSVKGVGSFKEPDFEKIAELDPDVIVIGGRQADKYDEFSKIAPTVDLSLDYTDIVTSNRTNTLALGEMFGKKSEAEQLLGELDGRIREAKAVAEKAGPGLIVMTNGGKVTAYGEKSRFGLIHELLGVPTAGTVDDAGTHGQAVSFEFIRDAAPRNLFVIDRDAAMGDSGNSAKATLDNALVRQTPAARDGGIHYLDASSWYNVGGGVTTLGKLIDEIREKLS